MGYTNIPPAITDRSSQLVEQKQPHYQQGIRREGRSWLPGLGWAIWGEDWLPGRRPSKGALIGLGFPYLHHSVRREGGRTLAALQKGVPAVARPEVELPAPACIGLSKLLLSVSGHENGWMA